VQTRLLSDNSDAPATYNTITSHQHELTFPLLQFRPILFPIVHHSNFESMSFPNFGEAGAQPQQPAQEHGGFGATGGPDQQQNPMGQQMDPQQMGQQMNQQQMGQQMGGQQMGQQMDQSQPQGQFQGAPTSGTPGAQGGQPQEGKTTLW
jgi:hypothetical protein